MAALYERLTGLDNSLHRSFIFCGRRILFFTAGEQSLLTTMRASSVDNMAASFFHSMQSKRERDRAGQNAWCPLWASLRSNISSLLWKLSPQHPEFSVGIHYTKILLPGSGELCSTSCGLAPTFHPLAPSDTSLTVQSTLNPPKAARSTVPLQHQLGQNSIT